MKLGLKRPVRRSTAIRVKINSKATNRGKGKVKPKSLPLDTKPLTNTNPTSRTVRHYAGMLGEAPETDVRKKKDGKGNGSGGGAASTASAFKSSLKTYTPPVKKYFGSDIGKGNGPERRRKNMYVAVERRRQGPKN